MGSSWQARKRKDHYYRLAKSQGYRSRASYKLKEMDRKFRILRSGRGAVDLGSAPGGWTQVLVERGCKPVVSVDIAPMTEVPGSIFILGDMRKDETLDRVLHALGGRAAVVVSDMAPNISGNYTLDQVRSVELAMAALNAARHLLGEGGNLAVKVFEGEDFRDYLDRVKEVFHRVRIFSPKASRSSSSEVYVIAKGYVIEGRDPERPTRGPPEVLA